MLYLSNATSIQEVIKERNATDVYILTPYDDVRKKNRKVIRVLGININSCVYAKELAPSGAYSNKISYNSCIKSKDVRQFLNCLAYIAELKYSLLKRKAMADLIRYIVNENRTVILLDNDCLLEDGSINPYSYGFTLFSIIEMTVYGKQFYNKIIDHNYFNYDSLSESLLMASSTFTNYISNDIDVIVEEWYKDISELAKRIKRDTTSKLFITDFIDGNVSKAHTLIDYAKEFSIPIVILDNDKEYKTQYLGLFGEQITKELDDISHFRNELEVEKLKNKNWISSVIKDAQKKKKQEYLALKALRDEDKANKLAIKEAQRIAHEQRIAERKTRIEQKLAEQRLKTALHKAKVEGKLNILTDIKNAEFAIANVFFQYGIQHVEKKKMTMYKQKLKELKALSNIYLKMDADSGGVSTGAWEEWQTAIEDIKGINDNLKKLRTTNEIILREYIEGEEEENYPKKIFYQYAKDKSWTYENATAFQNSKECFNYIASIINDITKGCWYIA